MQTCTETKCESSDIRSIDDATRWIAEIKRDTLEMGQLKSDFDCDKLTRAKEGHFLAHQFHFCMRQYSLALYEVRRMLVEIERNRRNIQRLYDEGADCELLADHEFADLKILEMQNEIELTELSLVNKKSIVRNMERIRQELIKQNGGPITNEQYQAEEPAYWKWFLERHALLERKQAETGIKFGTWLNMEHLEQPALLDPENQVAIMNEEGQIDYLATLAAIQRPKQTQERLE